MISYTLKTPVTHAGKTYKDLTFRKPRTGDLIVMDTFTGDVAKTVALFAAISEVPLPAFRDIELDDFNALSVLVAPLLGESLPSPADGSTS